MPAAAALTVDAPEERVHRLRAGDLEVELAVDTRRLEARFGPRFDRSAAVTSVRFRGHEYLDPRGLCDEFGLRGLGVLGYDDAAPDGGEFLKIGVGVLRRDDSGDYTFVRSWPVAASLPVTVSARPQELLVEQRSPGCHGFAYRLSKRYEVAPAGTLTVEYEVGNVGGRAFAFEHYNHNFFSFDGVASDGRYALRPAFALGRDGNREWSLRGGTLRLAAAAPAGRGSYFGVETAGVPVCDNRFTLSHAGGLAVAVSGDFPLARFAVWADAAAFCPEAFFRASVPPDGRVRWRHVYGFSPVGFPPETGLRPSTSQPLPP